VPEASLIDPLLEEEIECINGLVRMWDSLMERVGGTRAGGGVREDSAKAFIVARDEIARRYTAIMAQLEVALDEQDELLQMLGRMNSLGAVALLPDIQWKKLEEARGRVEVSVQGLLGALQNRQRAMAGVNGNLILVRRVAGSWPCRLLYLAVGIVIIFLVLSKIML
jgi:hypothetical protein